jgi:hypothetical protein
VQTEIAREAVVDDVVQNDAAVGVDRVVHLRPSAKGRDDDRDFVLDTGCQVLFKPLVGPVHDLVDGERRSWQVGIGIAEVGELLLDAVEPIAQRRCGASVERWKRPDDACLALGDDQLGPRTDEHR